MGTAYYHVPYMLFGDFNSDGKPDLVTAVFHLGQFGTNYSDTLLTFLGNGDGTFESPVATALEKGLALNYSEYESFDFNHDGDADLAISATDLRLGYAPMANGVHILLGLGDGRFRDASDFVTESLRSNDVRGSNARRASPTSTQTVIQTSYTTPTGRSGFAWSQPTVLSGLLACSTVSTKVR